MKYIRQISQFAYTGKPFEPSCTFYHANNAQCAVPSRLRSGYILCAELLYTTLQQLRFALSYAQRGLKALCIQAQLNRLL